MNTFRDDTHEWTACEMFGHEFDEDDRCRCGEHREADDDNASEVNLG